MYTAQDKNYDNNDMVEVTWPCVEDIFSRYTNPQIHRLYWNPNFDYSLCSTLYNLQDLCERVNQWRQTFGIDALFADSRFHYDLSNVVKFNIWVNQLQTEGNIKPWLILDEGQGVLLAGTGDSRLKCLERVPKITSVQAFVTTNIEQSHRYHDLELVKDFDRFAELCGAEAGQQFFFKFTDFNAGYGIRWYEHANPRTRSSTPGNDITIPRLKQYFTQNPDIQLSPDWFDNLIDWDLYTS